MRRGPRKGETFPLQGALVKTPVTELKGNKLEQQPVIGLFQQQRRCPFTISWPAHEVEHDLVCAAATSSDRAAWTKAINATLKRLRAGAPTSGWLLKQGGRGVAGVKGKMQAMAWKRRWFILTQPSEGRPATFAYYEGAQRDADRPLGLVLLNASAQLFVTEKTRRPHCFCITSQAPALALELLVRLDDAREEV